MSTTVTVPAGTSRADALKGLWRCSPPSTSGQAPPQLSAEKVEEYFQRNSWIYDLAGRCIQTDMSQFPKLDLRHYKTVCGNSLSITEIFEKCLKKKPASD